MYSSFCTSPCVSSSKTFSSQLFSHWKAFGKDIPFPIRSPFWGGTTGVDDGRIKGGTVVYDSCNVLMALLVEDVSMTTTSRDWPSFSAVGCWNIDMPVPWTESVAVVELGLWSILSTVAVVKRFVLSFGGHTTCSCSKRLQTLFANPADNRSTLSYEIHRPRWESLSTSSFFFVYVHAKAGQGK